MVAQNLSRVKLIHNPNYVRNGMKSYVSLLKKCMEGRLSGLASQC